MGIYKSMDIKINEANARFNEKFYVYQNDRGIELHLKLNLFQTNFKSNKRNLSFTEDSILVGATILKPNGEVVGRHRVPMVDDIIRFVIDEELTDDIDEIGVYRIQFHLYDEEDNRITIPPLEFEVKELIGIVEEDRPSTAIVDSTRVDFSIVGEDANLIEIISNGKYIKTQWKSGDIITAKKLNNIETALDDLINNPPLVDANDIRGGYYQVDSMEERDEIPLHKRKEGMLCYVKNSKIYQLLNGIENEHWVELKTNVQNTYVGEIFPESEDIFVWIDISSEEI